MELIKIPGKKRPVRAANWKEVEPIAKRIVRENKKFFEELEEL